MGKYYGYFTIKGSMFTCIPYVFTNKRTAIRDMRTIAIGNASPGDEVYADVHDIDGKEIWHITLIKK